MLTPLSEREKIFIQQIINGHESGKAYLITLEILGEKPCSIKSANVQGCRYYKRLKTYINEGVQDQFNKKKEERLDKRIELIEKAEKIQNEKEILDKVLPSGSTADDIKVSKHPILFNTLLNLGIIKCLFDEVKLSENGKEIVSAEINRENWLSMPFVKDLIGKMLLNKDMFDYKAKGGQTPPTVANQVNLTVNSNK